MRRSRRLPAAGEVTSALKAGGRQRNIDERARQIQAALRTEQLAAPEAVTQACGAITRATVNVLIELTDQISQLETTLAEHCEKHPDAEPPPAGDVTARRAITRQVFAELVPTLPAIAGVKVRRYTLDTDDGAALTLSWFYGTQTASPGSAVLYLHGGGYCPPGTIDSFGVDRCPGPVVGHL